MAWKNPTLNLSQFTSYSVNTIFTGATTANYVGFDISSIRERQSPSLYNPAWSLINLTSNATFTGDPQFQSTGFDIVTNPEQTKTTNPSFKLQPIDSNVAFTGDPAVTYGFDIKTGTEASGSTDRTGIYNTTYRTNHKNLTTYDNSKQFPTTYQPNPTITFSGNADIGFNFKNTAESKVDTNNLTYNATNQENVKNYQINQFNYASTAINGAFINPTDRLDTNQNINLKLWQGVTDPAPASNIDGTTAALFLAGYASSVLEGQASQAAGALLERSLPVPTYNTLDVTKTQVPIPVPGIKYLDFRSARLLTNPASIRLDGAAASVRGGGFNPRAAIYAAASAGPTGAYILFNLDGYGKTGYGWGDHDNRFANRRDFTLGSLVTTKWNSDESQFFQTENWIERATPFRGDKVTVIDFGKRQLKNAYQWRPRPKNSTIRDIDQTQDFIKFYFTGPKLHNSGLSGEGRHGAIDNIIAFRAIITSLSDRFSPNWVSGKILGRADETHTYQGYSRDLDMQFTVYATDRDELKPIWRKLNGLAGYTAPIYDGDSSAMIAPWLRITIGDLFVQQPIIIQSLTYTLHDNDTTWETNLENDKTMMQTPHKIDVSIDFKLITDALPQNEGSFYTLAKQFDDNGTPIKGNDNWLSDFQFGVLNNNDGPSGDKGGSTEA